jgi:HEPN domain-containing protein
VAEIQASIAGTSSVLLAVSPPVPASKHAAGRRRLGSDRGFNCAMGRPRRGAFGGCAGFAESKALEIGHFLVDRSSPMWRTLSACRVATLGDAPGLARLSYARLKAKRFDAAYYLAGYVIECALKACIAKKTKRHDFPDKDFARKAYTHDLEDLAQLAGLKDTLKLQFRQYPSLETQWGVVEVSRYEMLPYREARRKAEEIY